MTEPTAGHYLGCCTVLLPAVTPIWKRTGTSNVRFSRLCLVYVCRGNASLWIKHGIFVRRIGTQSRVMAERGVFRTVLVAQQQQCAEYFASCTHRATSANQIITQYTTVRSKHTTLEGCVARWAPGGTARPESSIPASKQNGQLTLGGRAIDSCPFGLL